MCLLCSVNIGDIKKPPEVVFGSPAVMGKLLYVVGVYGPAIVGVLPLDP